MKNVKLVADAVRVVLKNLAGLPDSPESRKLKERAGAYLGEAEDWIAQPPTIEQREQLMTKVLSLYTATSRIGGRGRG